MNLVVIGAQWGDEGKGKIVDFLAGNAEIVVRFSGGANAGHTIVHDGTTYKLHLVPSGIIYPGTTVVLGSGMVIDPAALFAELDELSAAGVDWQDRILISDRAHLVLPDYRREDVELDKNRKVPIGTTGRGIGVAYARKAMRDGIRVADLDDEEMLSRHTDEDRAYLALYRDRIRAMQVEIASFMAMAKDRTVLLEGAQGALLDLDLGTYPFVSSGSSAASGACIGAGIGPRDLGHILGVCKAYNSRVGNGPFPSEFDPAREGSLEDYIRNTGREFGVTTGRARRVGYLDLVALRYACRTNGITSLALTHLDVYDGMEEIKVCVAYETPDQTLEDMPSSPRVLSSVSPVTRKFPGWSEDISGSRSYEDLPENARSYIEFIESYVEVPVSVISVGYERAQTIVRSCPWTE